jgi:hypothetical protein
MTSLKVEVQVDKVVDVLIPIVNRYHVARGGYEMVVARGRSQPAPQSDGFRIHSRSQAGIKRGSPRKPWLLGHRQSVLVSESNRGFVMIQVVPIGRAFTVKVIERGLAAAIPVGAILSAIHPAASILSAVLCRG